MPEQTIEKEEHNILGMKPKLNKGCKEGVHPRDKVFLWHKINNPGFQSLIDSGRKVAGCMACKTTYVVAEAKKK